jgi:hypothetical protein
MPSVDLPHLLVAATGGGNSSPRNARGAFRAARPISDPLCNDIGTGVNHVVVKLSEADFVRPSKAFLAALEELLGSASAWLTYGIHLDRTSWLFSSRAEKLVRQKRRRYWWISGSHEAAELDANLAHCPSVKKLLWSAVDGAAERLNR